MIIRGSQRQQTSGKRAGTIGEQAPSLLSLYSESPGGEIAVEEFEKFAIKRLRVLKDIETEKAKGTKPGPYEEAIRASIKENLENGDSRMKLEDRIRLDQVSHYALRLALCKTDDQRRWFKDHEAALFRHRFETERMDTVRKAFLESNGIRVDLVRVKEMHPDLRSMLEELDESQKQVGI
eukprot:SAG31_NODE_1382_length_8579_cov_25.152830_2_plen_180_part_00